MSENKFFLIDGHAQLFQSFYAIPELTTPTGDPINAVYGFTLMLRKLFKNQKPQYIAIAFDTKGITFRHKSFKEYKANRKSMPDNLQTQIPLLDKVIEAYGISTFSIDGFEADDVMGTIVNKLTKQNIETILVTKDKDMEQLIGDNVKMFDVKKNSFFDLEKFNEKWGIKPLQIIEILALAGDSSDNVPGVPGIGYKTALKLVKEWECIERILENTDKIKANKTKESLIKYADQARLSKFLVTIDQNVPIEFNLEMCKMTDIDEEKTKYIFKEYGFNSFLN